jgi:hypothetical protein
MKPSLSPVWKQVSIFVYDKTSTATTPVATVLNRVPTTNNHLFYSNLVVTGSVNIAGTASFTVTNAAGLATSAEKSLFSDDYNQEGVAPTQKYVVIICGQDVIWSGKLLRSTSTTQTPFNRAETFGQWKVECESDVGKMRLQEVSPPTPPTVVGKVGNVISSILNRKSAEDVDWTGLHSGTAPLIYESIISNEGGTVSYKVQDTDMYSQFISIAKVSGFEWRTRLNNWVEDYTSWDPVTYVLGAVNVVSRFLKAEVVNRWVLFLGDSGTGSNIISYGQVSDTTLDTIDWDGGTGTVDLSIRNSTWQAQRFLSTKVNISKVVIKMKKVGTPTGTVTVAIETETYVPSARPSGVVLASASINVATLTTSFTDVTFTMSGALEINTPYYVTIKGSGGWVSGREVFLRERALPVSDTSLWVWEGAAAWTSYSFGYRIDLRTYYGAFILKNVVNPTLLPAHGGTPIACTFLNGGNYIYCDPASVPPINAVVVFATPVPSSGIVAGRNYVVVESNLAGDFRVGNTIGGTALTFARETVYSSFQVATFGTGRCVFLLDPVVDMCWDIEQPTPVQLFNINKMADSSNSICFDYNDKTDKKTVATKITVKGKNIDTTESSTGKSETISTTLYANCKWEPENTMFEKTTVVTHKMDGYVYAGDAGSANLYLIGQDYALQSGDVIDVWCRWTDGSAYELVTNRTITAPPTLVTQVDGTKTTLLILNSQLHGTKNCGKYSVVSARKTYVQDPTRVCDTPLTTNPVWFGGSTSNGKPMYKVITSVGTDTVYGKYIVGIASFDSVVNQVRPSFPGCLVSRKRGGESPDAGSPQALLGLIDITETVDQATTLGDLEVYATQSLINHSFYVRKASFQCFINDFTKPGGRGYGQVYDWTMIKEGDRIAVNPSSTLSTDILNSKYFDSQYKYLWEVVSWTLDANSMTITAILGDYETNVNVLISDKTKSLDGIIS